MWTPNEGPDGMLLDKNRRVDDVKVEIIRFVK